jgi:hypothetical protein
MNITTTKLAEALRGCFKEMLAVVQALNNEQMPHDGDAFHEHLEAARTALAAYDSQPRAVESALRGHLEAMERSRDHWRNAYEAEKERQAQAEAYLRAKPR